MNPPDEEPEALPPERPATLQDVMWYMRHWEDSIYIIVSDDCDSVEPIALSSLSPFAWSEFVCGCMHQGIVPVRHRGDEWHEFLGVKRDDRPNTRDSAPRIPKGKVAKRGIWPVTD